MRDPRTPESESFIGRGAQISALRELHGRPESQLAVVYGRRRVGKTALVHQAFAGERLVVIEGLENQSKPKQVATFLAQLASQAGGTTATRPVASDWPLALGELARALRGARTVVLLDEFQWLANYRTELVSSLKLVWEQHLSRAGKVTLILCGSIASFLEKKVVRSKALYGRTSLCIHLKPFRLGETAQLLRGRGWEEILLAQLLVGGIPQYLKLLGAEDSILGAMERLAFNDTGYFTEEYERIFVSHFGSSSRYDEVVRALAKRPQGLSQQEIAKAIGASRGGELTRILYNLESAGFITSHIPFDKPSRSRLVRYVLTDPFLRFHFAFLRPHPARRTLSSRSFVQHVVPSPAFRAWLARGFELLCLEHASDIAALLGFSGVQYRAGPYFRHRRGGTLEGVQVDLLYDRADRVITLCEMKYRDTPVGVDVAKEVQRKVEKLPWLERRTVQKVLITRSEPTRELLRSGFFSRILLAKDLIRPAP